jgi:hypothetical protein
MSAAGDDHEQEREARSQERRSRRRRHTRLLRQDARLVAPGTDEQPEAESPGLSPQPGPLREQLAPQSVPLASIVRCLVALVAPRRTTASSAGTVGHRASFSDGTPPSRLRMLRS